MKIGVLGAGSIGLLFGAYLSSKCTVTMFTRTEEQAIEIKEKGIRVFVDGKYSFTSYAEASHTYKEFGRQDLIIITVKNYHLKNIMEDLKSVSEDIPLLFLQNGMGHLKFIDALPQKNVFVGTVEHGAVRETLADVAHNGIGKTNLALYRGGKQALEELLSIKLKDFPFHFYLDYNGMLVRKLLANALINPLTAILNEPNGALITNKHYYLLFLDVFYEIVEVFPEIDKDEMLNEITGICRSTATNRSSMLKDMDHKTETEVESILGFILEKAEYLSLKIPITRSIYRVVKGMENGEDRV
jgi:2-dehydropantoate 2-reductase